MVTAAGRLDLVKRSFRCYTDQTYPNKELLIVNEGPVEYQQAIEFFVKESGRSDVRFVWLNGHYSLGALRNISIGLAMGDYFCQWDDDDFCLPHRLVVQFHHLQKHPSAEASYLGDQLHFYFPTQEVFWDDWVSFGHLSTLETQLIPGTLLCRRPTNVKYPSQGRYCGAGEDSVFAQRLQGRLAVLSGEDPMHVYSYHGKQVFDFEHHRRISTMRAKPIADVIRLRGKIEAALWHLRLAPFVRVMGKEGLAFMYRGDDA
jgi:glycosyltransferase involved in cell wall biosynthesis